MAGALMLAVIGLFARIVNFEMRNDEQLYAPPAVLLGDQQLYADVFYNHVPGTAWLFHAVTELSSSSHFLFTARMVVFCGWLLMAAILAWSAVRLTKSLSVAALLLVLLFSNQYFLGPTGAIASNNFLPLPFIYLGLFLFIVGVERVEQLAGARDKIAPLILFASGAAISIAATLKANAAIFVFPVAIGAFFAGNVGGLRQRFVRTILPVAAGGLVAAIPLIVIALRDFETFFAHVLSYHTGPQVAYWQVAARSEPGVAMSVPAKAVLLHQIFFTGANLLLFAAIAVAVFLRFTSVGVRSLLRSLKWSEWFVLGSAALALIVSFTPTPSFPQYFAQPLIVLMLFFLLFYRSLAGEAKHIANTAMAALAVIGAIGGAPRLVQDLPSLGSPAKWAVNRTHQDGLKIAQELQKRGVDGPVATLFPVYPLAGGLSVYPEFATGPFAYRTGDVGDPDLIAHYVTTSPLSVANRLANEPPAAVLLGFADELEAPIAEFVEQNSYQRTDLVIKSRYGEAVLYVRPPG